MAEYVSYFIEDPRQIWALVSVIALWTGMTSIGHLFVRGKDESVFAPVIGWTVIVATYTIFGTLTQLSFTMIAGGLAVLAIIAGALAIRRGAQLFDPMWLRMVALAAPLLILASAMQGSQWDEFSHWLTGQSYLLRVDMFPGDGRPLSSVSYPAYPYGWQLLGYLASRVVGFHVESASGLINILLLLSLGRVVISIAFESVGKDIKTTSLSPWLIAGMAGISVTLLNPTFVQKVILTAYADTATSVSLTLGMILGARAIIAVENGARRDATRGILLGGLALGVLVTLKQSTLELFLLGLIGLVAFGAIKDFRNVPRVLLTVVLISIPGVILYVVWRLYVSDQLAGEEFSFLPFDQWNFDLIPTILTVMGHVLLKKSAYLLAVLLAIFWGLRSFKDSSFANRFLLAAALVFVGHISFLFLCYVAVFSGHEARTAASFWRYNQQLGGLAIVTISISVAWLLMWMSSRTRIHRAAWLPALLLLIAPMIFAHKLRFDTEPNYAHYRLVGVDLLDHISVGSRVSILDPIGTGESAVIARFYASPLEVPVTYISGFHRIDVERQLLFINRSRGGFLLVHSVTDATREAITMPLKDRTSYLFSVDDAGNMTSLGEWTWPEKMRL